MKRVESERNITGKPGDNPPTPAVRKAKPAVKQHHTRKTLVGRGSIVEKGSATVRHCKKCDFVSTGKTEGESKAEIMAHYKKDHPKKKPAAKRTYNPRGGQLTAGMGLDKAKTEMEESTTGLKINKDKDVRHAFDILQTRSNDGSLSSAEEKTFEGLLEETEGLSGITEWPTGLRGRVIKLYNEVVNGVSEEVKT
jgi:hypothetical protein